MNQDTLLKIANEVVKNRMLKQAMNPFLYIKPEAVRTMMGAVKEIAEKPQAAVTAVRRSAQLTKALRDLISGSVSRVGDAAKAVSLNPVAQNIAAAASLFGLGTLGGYGVQKLRSRSPATPATPAVPAPAPVVPAAPAVPAGPMNSAVEGAQPTLAAGGNLASYLDLLRANAPAVGALTGGLSGAAIGAATSRKARIRDALIGFAAGTALGGGAGYLMNR